MIITINKWFKSFKKEKLEKEHYKELLKKNILRSYKQVGVFAFFIVLIFVICFLISGHFNYLDESIATYYVSGMPLGLLLFLVILILNYAFYINISIISSKYTKNTIDSIIITYLFWIVLALFINIILGLYVFDYQLNIKLAPGFEIMNLYTWSSMKYMVVQTLIALILFVSSFFIMYLIYKKQEKTNKKET